jgi:hypothetical protein
MIGRQESLSFRAKRGISFALAVSFVLSLAAFAQNGGEGEDKGYSKGK